MTSASQFIGGTISNYTQSAILTTSQTVTVPIGVNRIEVLLVGGGGAGSGAGGSYNTAGGGGGFGGFGGGSFGGGGAGGDW